LQVQSSWIAKTERLTLFSTITAMIAALLLTSCSGFFPPADQIISLQLSPTSAWIKPTTTQQFSATATFGNNNTGDVTSQVTWQSSSPSIATIDSSGLATAVALGSTTITAKSNNSSVTATALMTVSDKTITGLTVNPNSTSISLSAAVTFSDGTMQDVTTTAAWTSSVPSVASISSTGLASPISEGTTTISASAAGVVGTAALTVTQ
jgi:trimeric autotransporter adhesin